MAIIFFPRSPKFTDSVQFVAKQFSVGLSEQNRPFLLRTKPMKSIRSHKIFNKSVKYDSNHFGVSDHWFNSSGLPVSKSFCNKGLTYLQ